MEQELTILKKEQEGFNTKIIKLSNINLQLFSGLLISLPLSIIFYYIFYNVNNYNYIEIYCNNFTWTQVIICVILVCVHELIHGLTYIITNKKGFENLKFGFNTKYYFPYCHFKQTSKLNSYIFSAIMPGVILGFVLAILAIVLNSPELLIQSIFGFFGASADFLITFLVILFVIKLPKDSIIEVYDLPKDAGCAIFYKQNK